MRKAKELYYTGENVSGKEAEEIGLSLPGLALVQQLYLAVKAQGHGRSGTHALFLALASLSGGASPHSK